MISVHQFYLIAYCAYIFYISIIIYRAYFRSEEIYKYANWGLDYALFLKNSNTSLYQIMILKRIQNQIMNVYHWEISSANRTVSIGRA